MTTSSQRPLFTPRTSSRRSCAASVATLRNSLRRATPPRAPAMGKKSKVCSETDLIKGNFAIGPPLKLAGEGGAVAVLGNACMRECVATLERAPDATAWAWVLPAARAKAAAAAETAKAVAALADATAAARAASPPPRTDRGGPLGFLKGFARKAKRGASPARERPAPTAVAAPYSPPKAEVPPARCGVCASLEFGNAVAELRGAGGGVGRPRRDARPQRPAQALAPRRVCRRRRRPPRLRGGDGRRRRRRRPRSQAHRQRRREARRRRERRRRRGSGRRRGGGGGAGAQAAILVDGGNGGGARGEEQQGRRVPCSRRRPAPRSSGGGRRG